MDIHCWKNFFFRISLTKQLSVIDVPFEIFTSESNDMSDVLRKQLIDKVCIPLLENAHVHAFKEFFCLHIKQIVNILQTSVTHVSFVPAFFVRNTSKLCVWKTKWLSIHFLLLLFLYDQDKQTRLLLQIGCCKLIEILYTRLHKEDISSLTSNINRSFCEGAVETGKELTTTISKYVFISFINPLDIIKWFRWLFSN